MIARFGEGGAIARASLSQRTQLSAANAFAIRHVAFQPWATMVRNIIEDSDDEGDFGALSPIASRPASPTPPDAPDPDAPTHIQRTAPATSSTGPFRYSKMSE